MDQGRGQEQHLKLLPGRIYIHPSGYKVRMAKHHAAPSWRLVGTVPEGAFCHKPCTVSGGGKSEISKSLVDAVLPGSFYVRELRRGHGAGPGDLRPELRRRAPGRRTRGPIASAPVTRALARLGDQAAHAQPGRVHPGVQRLAREHPEPRPGAGVRDQALLPAGVGRRLAAATSAWTSSTAPRGTSSSTRGGSWSPTISGSGGTATAPGGPTSCGRTSWRPTRCRWRTTSPRRWWCPRGVWSGLPGEYDGHPSLKLAQNCEFRLFQRPDDAIHPGLDRQTEKDMAGPGLFCSNFQPLDTGGRAGDPGGRRGARRLHGRRCATT